MNTKDTRNTTEGAAASNFRTNAEKMYSESCGRGSVINFATGNSDGMGLTQAALIAIDDHGGQFPNNFVSDRF